MTARAWRGRAARAAAPLTLLFVSLAGLDAGEGPTWWSLRPLARPPVPRVEGAAPRAPLDAFIAEKLAQEGLRPSPEADRRALIRRVVFDLWGLPPTPGEVDRFVADPSPNAYRELVDRLLESPRYGERWGRHWLDVVHYGETHGYDKDKRRPNAWPYRDYVIRSLNADKPYARFVEEQLAGDVLYPHEPDGVVALGFIAAGPWDFVGHVELREGTVDKGIARSNDRDDMVTAAMSTFLSLTVHCARCHDHKFDPIPQEDYYRMQAAFAGVERADRPYDVDPETFRLRKTLSADKRALEEKMGALEKVRSGLRSPELLRLSGRLEDLKKELAAARARAASPSNGYHSAVMPEREAMKWVQVDLGSPRPIDEVRLVPARPTDFPDTPGFGFPERFRVDVSDDPSFRERSALADHTGEDFAGPGDRPERVPAGGRRARFVRVTATRLWQRTGDYVFALAELEVLSEGKNVAAGAPVEALDSIEAGRWSRRFLVDGYSSRGSLEDAPGAGSGAARAAEIEAEIGNVSGEREAAADALLPSEARGDIQRARSALAEVGRSLSALPPPSFVYAAAGDFAPQGSFTPPRGPRPIHLLARGDVTRPGKPVAPGPLSCLSELQSSFRLEDPGSEGARRAALARWISDSRNPLTWRSIVNRVWHYHFGRGLVDTPGDFGRMGSLPTHPQLLDWLAAWFVENGGSLKKLHRLILESEAYRRSSRDDPLCSRLDADNRYLWRMNRSRLEAEAIRDSVLFACGKLDLTVGGPPADHFLFKDDHSPVYDYTRFDVDSPPSFRRSVYRAIVRSVPEPFLWCLDCADPSLLTHKRSTTLTALQALAMLNDPFMVRASERLAERVQGLSADLSGQIEAAYRLCLARPPGAGERRLLEAYAAEHGLPNACRLIFNSNEFLFID